MPTHSLPRGGTTGLPREQAQHRQPGLTAVPLPPGTGGLGTGSATRARPRESPQGIPPCVSSRVGPPGSVCSHWKQKKRPAKVLWPLAKWIPTVFSRQIGKCPRQLIPPPGRGPRSSGRTEDPSHSAPRKEKPGHPALTLSSGDPALTIPQPGAQGQATNAARSRKGRHGSPGGRPPPLLGTA